MVDLVEKSYISDTFSAPRKSSVLNYGVNCIIGSCKRETFRLLEQKERAVMLPSPHDDDDKTHFEQKKHSLMSAISGDI
jgi:hypothetical protein